MTVDHLFGTVWTSEELGVRYRRPTTIGILAALGKSDLLDIQFDCALERGELLTVDQLREVVVHITHYIGWPMSTGMNQTAENVIAVVLEKAAVGRQELMPVDAGARSRSRRRAGDRVIALAGPRYATLRHRDVPGRHRGLTRRRQRRDGRRRGAHRTRHAFTPARTWPKWPPSPPVPPWTGAGQGFMACSTAHRDSVPLLAAVNGVAVGLGFTVLGDCDLVLVAPDAAARALRRAGRPSRGRQTLLVPVGHGLAARRPRPAHVRFGQRGRARDARVALLAAPRRGPRPDVDAGGAHRVASAACATRAARLAHAGGAARRGPEANRRDRAPPPEYPGGAARRAPWPTSPPKPD